MGQMLHTTTGTTLYWAVYWVGHAAVIAFLTTAVLAAPFYLGPFVMRAYRRLFPRRRQTG
jgi:hypothetical protein